MSIGNTEKMNNFEKIISNLKKALKIDTDKELSLRLDMKTNTFSERKRTNSIPHNEILELCITEKLDLNEIYTDNKVIKNEVNFKEEILQIIENSNEKELELFYYLLKAETIKK